MYTSLLSRSYIVFVFVLKSDKLLQVSCVLTFYTSMTPAAVGVEGVGGSDEVVPMDAGEGEKLAPSLVERRRTPESIGPVTGLQGTPDVGMAQLSDADSESISSVRDENANCVVCTDGGWSAENKIVFCEGKKCRVVVHQDCYGITKVPEGDIPWLCDLCANKNVVRKDVICSICDGNADQGAMKRAPSGNGIILRVLLHLPKYLTTCYQNSKASAV